MKSPIGTLDALLKVIKISERLFEVMPAFERTIENDVLLGRGGLK